MMLFPKGVQDDNSDTIIYIYGNWTIKQMDGKLWEPDFPLLVWKVTDKEGEGARIVHRVIGYKLETSVWNPI